jgi:hypothetical protein
MPIIYLADAEYLNQDMRLGLLFASQIQRGLRISRWRPATRWPKTTKMFRSRTAPERELLPVFLPTEILCEIFAWAAAMSPVYACTLCLVASWTKQVAQRHLYTTIYTLYPGHARMLMHVLGIGTIPGQDTMTELAAKHTRRLWIHLSCNGLEIGEDMLPRLLQVLPNLECLSLVRPAAPMRGIHEYLPIDAIVDSLIYPGRTLEPGSLVTVAGNVELAIGSLPKIIPNRPPLSLGAISRLRIYAFDDCRDPISYLQEFCLVAPAYSSLTHLCIGVCEFGSAAVEQPRLASLRELRALGNLEMLVFGLDERVLRRGLEHWMAYAQLVVKERAHNSRLFLGMREHSMYDDWRPDTPWRGDSVWDRARTFTARLERGVYYVWHCVRDND